MEETLLQQVKKYPRKKRLDYSEEHFELIEAWLKDEISVVQITKFMSKGKTSSSASAQNFIAYGMREMYRKGIIKMK